MHIIEPLLFNSLPSPTSLHRILFSCSALKSCSYQKTCSALKYAPHPISSQTFAELLSKSKLRLGYAKSDGNCLFRFTYLVFRFFPRSPLCLRTMCTKHIVFNCPPAPPFVNVASVYFHIYIIYLPLPIPLVPGG